MPPTEWRDAQQRTHERFWPDVDRLLSGLPPHLFRQTKLLEYDLALRYSETGRFSDVFLGVNQFPILSVASWVLDDLGVRPGTEREHVERHLFLASVLFAARVHTVQGIGAPGSFYDNGHLALVQLLGERALSELVEVVPAGSSFWEQHEAIVAEDLERTLRQSERGRASGAIDDLEAFLPGPWAAPATLLALAATTFAQQGGDVRGRAGDVLNPLAAAFQIRADVASMHRDLIEGRPTYAIGFIALRAGIALSPWPDANVILGAMVATESLPAILDEALARVRRSRQATLDLGLPTLAAYAAGVESRFEPPTGTPARGGHRSASGPVLLRAQPAVPHALAMAEGLLLADPALRESWETHREGMFGAPVVVSRFPVGLVLEVLGTHGHDVSAQVDDFLAYTDANGFRYYDHAWADPDTDTIGVCLRLRKWAGTWPWETASLTAVLDCLEREARSSGAVPVWLRRCEAADDARPPVMALGEGCATVAAHLLLGLLEAGQCDDVVRIGGGGLLERVREVGVAANVNYPPLYALAILLRLLARLEASGSDLGSRVGDARRVLTEQLETARRRTALSAQDAALLTIACLEADSPQFIEPGWARAILKQQRYDGGWTGEPFAATPNRGGWVTWYASMTLTTALCYDALRRSARERDA